MSKHSPNTAPPLRPRWRAMYVVRWVQSSGQTVGRRVYVQEAYARTFTAMMRLRGFHVDMFETTTRWARS